LHPVDNRWYKSNNTLRHCRRSLLLVKTLTRCLLEVAGLQGTLSDPLITLIDHEEKTLPPHRPLFIFKISINSVSLFDPCDDNNVCMNVP
jgi:hypothetical protein